MFTLGTHVHMESRRLHLYKVKKEASSWKLQNHEMICVPTEILLSHFWYTHKTSGYKTSGFKTSGFKTSETSGLQNVKLPNIRFTKCQVYKTSGLQNVQLQKKHPYLFCGGNPQVLLQPCLQAKWWLCFILYFRGLFCHISP